MACWQVFAVFGRRRFSSENSTGIHRRESPRLFLGVKAIGEALQVPGMVNQNLPPLALAHLRPAAVYNNTPRPFSCFEARVSC